MAEVMLGIGIVFASLLLSILPAMLFAAIPAHIIAFLAHGPDYAQDNVESYFLYPFLWFQSITWLLIGYVFYYYSHLPPSPITP